MKIYLKPILPNPRQLQSKSTLERCCDRDHSPDPPRAGAWSAVHTPHGGHGGGQAPGQAFADLPVVLGLGLQERPDVLQGAGGLQAQGVHHVDQVVCGAGDGSAAGRTGPTKPPSSKKQGPPKLRMPGTHVDLSKRPLL